MYSIGNAIVNRELWHRFLIDIVHTIWAIVEMEFGVQDKEAGDTHWPCLSIQSPHSPGLVHQSCDFVMTVRIFFRVDVSPPGLALAFGAFLGAAAFASGAAGTPGGTAGSPAAEDAGAPRAGALSCLANWRRRGSFIMPAPNEVNASEVAKRSA